MFRLIADSIPMIPDRALTSTAARGHDAGPASIPDFLPAALRMLSPVNVSLWALGTSRSRMASAIMELAMASCRDRLGDAGHDSGAAIVPIIDDLQ